MKLWDNLYIKCKSYAKASKGKSQTKQWCEVGRKSFESAMCVCVSFREKDRAESELERQRQIEKKRGQR